VVPGKIFIVEWEEEQEGKPLASLVSGQLLVERAPGLLADFLERNTEITQD
jgi:hypothetical protein